jgi:hypothetical protein
MDIPSLTGLGCIQSPHEINQTRQPNPRILLIFMTKAKVYHQKGNRKPPTNYGDPDVIRHMKQACEDISNGSRYINASQKYDIPEGTLRNCYNGQTQSRKKAHVHRRLMDDSQEKVLVDWMMFLGVTDCPMSHTTLRPKCVEICGKLPGKTWIWRFLKRHPEVNLKKGSGLDPKCAQAFNYPEVKVYFEKLMKVIRENDIPWENIYNMDEQLGGGRKGAEILYFL